MEIGIIKGLYLYSGVNYGTIALGKWREIYNNNKKRI